jgi:hypothetical protein
VTLGAERTVGVFACAFQPLVAGSTIIAVKFKIVAGTVPAFETADFITGIEL